MRSVSRRAPLVGIAAVTAALALTGRYFLQPIIDQVSAVEFSFGLVADFTFILRVPVVYLVASCAVWILARVGGWWLYAAIANRMISAGLVGAVYGGDAEDVLMRVTGLPPLLGKARELCIAALQLGGIDDKAIFESAQKVYEDALANEKSEGGLSDPDRLWKLLYDALYHNAYYARSPRHRHPTVAEHIAQGLRSLGDERR